MKCRCRENIDSYIPVTCTRCSGVLSNCGHVFCIPCRHKWNEINVTCVCCYSAM